MAVCNALLAVFVFGAIIATVILMRISPGALILRSPGPHHLWVIVSGGIGSGLALFVCRHRFGCPGLLTAALSMVVITLLAALIGGSLAMPLYGTMFGLFLLLITFVASPLLAVLWAITFCAVHVLAAGWQAERDSIFRITPAVST